eukprot:COSAG06_NODE_13296_length_1271_cov_4.081058_1_plen_141_part_10
MKSLLEHTQRTGGVASRGLACLVTTEPVAAHALRMLAESFVRRRWEQAIAAATHVRLVLSCLVLSCLVLWMAMAQPLHYTAIERRTVANAACQRSSVLVCLPACWFCLRLSSETRAMLWCVRACCRQSKWIGRVWIIVPCG